jgi:hypothetical protein
LTHILIYKVSRKKYGFLVIFFLKNVYFLLNFVDLFGIITIATEVADSGEPQALVSADTHKKVVFC